MFYAFPPFSILLHVIKKIEYDGATGILIVPNWPTQVWFPLLRRLLLAEPLMLRSAKSSAVSNKTFLFQVQ